MIKKIDKLNTIYNGELLIDSSIDNEIKKIWNDFIKDKDPSEYFDGDIYCVTDIDDTVPLLKISKTKYSCLIFAIRTNKIIVRSLFSAGYIRTSDNYICIILNNRDRLNTIGGMASSSDFNNNKFDYDGCLIREFREELGFDLTNDSNFEVILKYLKYPSFDELNISHYPVGTLYEIKTKYTKDILLDRFNYNERESEVKELKFYNSENFREVYSYDNKTEYLDELFNILFEMNN